MAPHFISVILQTFLESGHGIIHQKDSHQNLPFISKIVSRFISYHTDHREGYHAECLKRWNVMTHQRKTLQQYDFHLFSDFAEIFDSHSESLAGLSL